MFFLKFIGFIFLFFIVCIIIGVGWMLWSVKRVHNRIKERYGGEQANTESRSTYGTEEGDVIHDHRNREKQKDKKIIPDGEGEYIDYVEEP